MTTKKFVDSALRIDTKAVGREWASRFRMDAAASIFFTRQLEDIDAMILDTKYAKLKALEFVQLAPGLDPLAERHTFRSRDWQGQKAKRSAHPTDTAPLAQTSRKEESSDYAVYKEGFAYSIDELRKSAKYGENLDRERGEAARALLAQSLDALIATGDAEISTAGLLTLSNTEVYTAPSDGTSGSKLWSAKSPDLILRDMNGIVTQVFTDSLEIESVKRMILPSGLYRQIQSTARSTTSDLSILEYFKRNNPGVEVMSWERLGDSTKDLYGNSCNGTSIGSNLNRIVAGDFSASNVRALVPVMSEMLEPERQGEGYKIDIRMKVGPVESPFPKAICYADGV